LIVTLRQGATVREAIFTNGVFRAVVDEIVRAQKKDANLISYLQPHSSETIKLLAQINQVRQSHCAFTFRQRTT